MKLESGIRTAVRYTIIVVIALFIAGCSSDNNEMSQEEIQYLSHLDQSRFFQRQGELKASTLEARSAIEMQPNRVEPYLVIINNLITAGDARNAERQLNALMESIDPDSISQQSLNDAALVEAEAKLMQQDYEQALTALDKLQEPDRGQQLEAALMRGDIHLAAGRNDSATEAFTAASKIDPTAARPLIGLSRVSYNQNLPEQVQNYLTQAEEIDPDHVELWLWKARLAHARKEWVAAEEGYINALETIGQYDIMTYEKFETMSALVDVLRQQGKSAEAFVYEEILAKSPPGTIRSNMLAAQDSFNDGDLNRAAGYLEEVLTMAPSNDQAAMMLGIIRFRQGRAEDAERLLTPIAARDESDQANQLLAATRLQLRDPEGAREVLSRIDDQDSDPATLALVGIASLASGDFESGEQLIEKSLELNPDNNSLRLRYANYHIQNNNADRAIALAKAALERDSSSVPSRQMLIRAQVAAGNLDAAIATTSAWLTDQPKSLQALVTRGDLARQANNEAQASEFYQKAKRAAPDNPFPLLALGNLEQAKGNQDEARTFYADALRLAPDNREALRGLSAITSPADMEPLMRELRQSNPEAIGPRLMLLESALINDDQTLADELTASLTEREEQNTPTPAESLVARVYSSIGTQMAQRNRNEEALQIFTRGRSLFPTDETLGVQAASLYFSQDDASEARKVLSDVKQAHPDSPAPFAIEARYFERQGDFSQAAELFQLALDKEPQNPGLMMSLASLYQSNNKQDEAVEIYQALIKLQPNSAAALNNLAWIYQEQDKPEAMELARRAYELSPQNAAIADTYGWILLKNGQKAESVKILEQAHNLAPGSEEIATHLAEAYRAVGNEEKARKILEKP